MPESCTLYLCRSLNVPEVRLLYSIIQEFVNMCDLLLISFFISQACNCTVLLLLHSFCATYQSERGEAERNLADFVGAAAELVSKE